jgi:hypothetical protein
MAEQERLYWTQWVGVLDVSALGGPGHTNFKHQLALAAKSNPHFLPAIRAGADPTEDWLPQGHAHLPSSDPIKHPCLGGVGDGRQDLSWILTDFDPMKGEWLTAGFELPHILDPKTSEKAKALLLKLQSLDASQHSVTAKAIVNCFCKALEHMLQVPAFHYGPLLAWAKMLKRPLVLIDGEYPFPANWETGDWNKICKDLVTGLAKVADNLGVGLDLTVGAADELMEKSRTTRLSTKEQNWDTIHALFGNLDLAKWKDPDGFVTFFNNEAVMTSQKLRVISPGDDIFRLGVEVWMPRLGLAEDRPTLPTAPLSHMGHTSACGGNQRQSHGFQVNVRRNPCLRHTLL